MTYYVKFGGILKWNLFLLVISSYWIVKYYFWIDKPHIMDYIITIEWFFLIATILLPRLIKFLYFVVKNKPAFTANISFIFDQYQNTKYYWEDIEEVIVSDDYLQIKLTEPLKYLDKIGNPSRKFIKKLGYKLFKIKPSYSINIGILNIEKGGDEEFVDALNQFSIAAES